MISSGSTGFRDRCLLCGLDCRFDFAGIIGPSTSEEKVRVSRGCGEFGVETLETVPWERVAGIG